MVLVLHKSKHELDTDVIQFLIKCIKDYIIKNINVKKLKRWEEYLNSPDFIITKLYKYISPKNIIISGASNLISIETQNSFIIKIDDNVVIANTSLNLNSMCKLIDQGNLQMYGYPIFTKAFAEIRNNLNYYLHIYDNNYLE